MVYEKMQNGNEKGIILVVICGKTLLYTQIDGRSNKTVPIILHLINALVPLQILGNPTTNFNPRLIISTDSRQNV